MGTSDGTGTWGEYVLLDVIGRGPHSTVHRARRRDRSGRIVALKHLHADVAGQAVDRLRRSSATLAALEHPAICPLLDVVGGPDGTVALVSPYAAGGSLQDLLERAGPLPWGRVADLGERLASALSAAHDAGVVHGGITPANVLLDARGMPRLTDFGTADLYGDGPDPDGGPSVPGDVHDLGRVLRRALADQPPVPARLAAAIEQAVAPQPADRYATAEPLRQALAAFESLDEPTLAHGMAAPGSEGSVDDHDTATLAAGAAQADVAPHRSRPAWAGRALAGLAAVAVVVLAGLWLAGWGQDAPRQASTTSAEGEQTSPRWPPPRCAGVDDPVAQGEVLEADVDGRGCALPVLVTEELVDDQPTVVVMVPAGAGALAGRYALGEAGDEVAVVIGDWDCDGSDTPAVVHTSDGEVFQFDGYGELTPTQAPAMPAGADPQVVTDEDGCDHVVG